MTLICFNAKLVTHLNKHLLRDIITYMNSIPIEYPTNWSEYQLLDSGDGEKLEEFSGYKVARPDPRVIWNKSKPVETWQNANAIFDRNSAQGKWIYKNPPPKNWQLHYNNLTFNLKPTDFRHVGIFPEQAVNWDWLAEKINNQPLKILNLFAYTGGSTVAASKAGAKVTHVDASKNIISWAKENALSSGLANDAIRWIEDDAYKFVAREDRRNSKYDGIILDPPRFGHGAKGEIWKLQDDLSSLLVACKRILSPNPKFVLMSVYTADLSAVAVGQLMESIFGDFGGKVNFAELALKEVNSGRLLPNGIVARWTNF